MIIVYCDLLRARIYFPSKQSYGHLIEVPKIVLSIHFKTSELDFASSSIDTQIAQLFQNESNDNVIYPS